DRRPRALQLIAPFSMLWQCRVLCSRASRHSSADIILDALHRARSTFPDTSIPPDAAFAAAQLTHPAHQCAHLSFSAQVFGLLKGPRAFPVRGLLHEDSTQIPRAPARALYG